MVNKTTKLDAGKTQTSDEKLRTYDEGIARIQNLLDNETSAERKRTLTRILTDLQSGRKFYAQQLRDMGQKS